MGEIVSKAMETRVTEITYYSALEQKMTQLDERETREVAKAT